jgi:hypothetical protein
VPAVLFGMAVWWYCKRQGLLPLTLPLATFASLWLVNGNLWVLAAVLIFLLSARTIDLRIPRLRWAFYGYYPIHLVAHCLIRIPMSKAGYLFFNFTLKAFYAIAYFYVSSAGVICLILQITVIGWITATIWAVYAFGQYKTDKKIEYALNKKWAWFKKGSFWVTKTIEYLPSFL